jgi:hypothetical protein
VVAVFIAKVDNLFGGMVFIVIAKLVHQVGNHDLVNFLWFIKKFIDKAIAGFYDICNKIIVAVLPHQEQV